MRRPESARAIRGTGKSVQRLATDISIDGDTDLVRHWLNTAHVSG